MTLFPSDCLYTKHYQPTTIGRCMVRCGGLRCGGYIKTTITRYFTTAWNWEAKIHGEKAHGSPMNGHETWSLATLYYLEALPLQLLPSSLTLIAKVMFLQRKMRSKFETFEESKFWVPLWYSSPSLSKTRCIVSWSSSWSPKTHNASVHGISSDRVESLDGKAVPHPKAP